MPTKPEGVYHDGRGGWYLKVNVGRDPLTGKREQITKRGFRTATEAGPERREILNKIDTGQLSPTPAGLTVNELLDLYLDGIEANGVLSVKTCDDYRHYADDYVRPHLGHRRLRDILPEVVLAWQRKILKEGANSP